MTILSIDPGKSGGIAWKIGNSPACEKMPETERDIYDLIHSIAGGALAEPTVVYMEDVPIGMPGKGAASSKLNANAGFIRGVFAAMELRLVMIKPAKWQKYFSLGTRSACVSDSQWKNKLKQEAQRRFPGIKVTLEKADALLLLDYAIAQEK